MAALATPVVAMAQDREPIRVRNKTLLFELSGKSWKRDRIGEQWKPVPADEADTRRFEVKTIQPSAGCATFTATEVRLDVVVDGSTRPFRIYPRRNFDPTSGAFWSREPKLDSPIDLEAVATGKRLQFKLHKEVYIAAVYGDGQKRCEFQSTTPVVELEAKPM